MNKIILLIFFTFFSCKNIPSKVHNQIQTQSLNSKNNEMLNNEEAELLNSLLQKERNKFDFHGKKIAFITGSLGNIVLSKTDYFNTCINPWLTNGKTPQIFMIELTSEEKNKSGGYDAFVLSWVKVFTEKQKEKVIEQIPK